MTYRRDSFERERSGRSAVPAYLFMLLLGALFLFPGAASKLARAVFSISSFAVFEKNVVKGNAETLYGLFLSKESLETEVANLSNELARRNGLEIALALSRKEEDRLRALLGREPARTRVIAAVISRPSRSPYDTFIIDAGEGRVAEGSRVFSLEGVLIGTVETVYPGGARISLFSTPGRRFDARIGGHSPIEVMGRGGGSFEAVVPQALTVAVGDEVTVPGLNRLAVGSVEEILSDPREPLMKLLILSPVSFESLEYVAIER